MSENYNSEILEQPSIYDFIDGAESGVTYDVITDAWVDFLPTKENQYRLIKRKSFDVSACATFAVLNAIEAQINYLIRAKLLDTDKLEELGLLDGNFRANFSDRWLAKVSGTTKNGNSSWKIGDIFRTKGSVAEDKWAWDKDIDTWDKYYSEVDSTLFEIAKKILEIVEVKQEWLYYPQYGINGDVDAIIRKHTKHAPLVISAPVCPSWSRYRLTETKNKVSTCTVEEQGDTSHATIIFGVDENGDYLCFDHYEPHIKRLPKDYPIKRIWKPVVTVKVPPKPVVVPKYQFTTDLSFGMRGEAVKQLQIILIKEGLLRSDLVTSYFGEHTKRSVTLLQEKYANEILKPVGLTKGTGYFGVSTRKYINKKYG